LRASFAPFDIHSGSATRGGWASCWPRFTHIQVPSAMPPQAVGRNRFIAPLRASSIGGRL